jgi:hypothetical protein
MVMLDMDVDMDILLFLFHNAMWIRAKDKAMQLPIA